MNKISRLMVILSGKKYFVVFIAGFIMMSAILSVSAGIIVLPFLEFNIVAEPLGIAAVFFIAFLSALNFSVALNVLSAIKKVMPKTFALGPALGLFTTACPVCQPAWLIWLGLGTSTAFLSDYGIYISVISIVLLLFSLNLLLSENNKCGVQKNG